jgi:hypothetical protein
MNDRKYMEPSGAGPMSILPLLPPEVQDKYDHDHKDHDPDNEIIFQHYNDP